ncbi:MAG: cobalt ABC transporter permease [Deltaproteobacteria bacterium]|nr:cobalt ABC transporter permease [Deltaproteobacteria bacterium]
MTKILSLIGCLVLIFSVNSIAAQEKEKWSGVDEQILEKFATEYGRKPLGPIINTDQGDLLLFLFLLAGLLSGFVAGYNWRILMEGYEKRRKTL